MPCQLQKRDKILENERNVIAIGFSTIIQIAHHK